MFVNNIFNIDTLCSALLAFKDSKSGANDFASFEVYMTANRGILS